MAVISPFPSFKSQTYYPVGVDCVLYHAYWDGTATDHSGKGCTGTVIDGTFVDNGIYLNGTTSRVDVVAHQAILAPHTGDYTVYGWFKLAGTPLWDALLCTWGDNCLIWVLVNGNGYGDHRGWILVYDFVDSYDYDFFGTSIHVNWPANLTDGNWHMVAYPINRGTVIPQVVYLDNVVKVSANPLYTNTYNWQNFTQFDIGMRQGLGGLTGTIGEVLLFKSCKSVSDISDYYNATKARYL